jgi:hypothetical protein
MLGSQSVLLPVVRVPKPDSIKLETPSVDLPYRKLSECSDSPGTRTSRMSQLKKLVVNVAKAFVGPIRTWFTARSSSPPDSS